MSRAREPVADPSARSNSTSPGTETRRGSDGCRTDAFSRTRLQVGGTGRVAERVRLHLQVLYPDLDIEPILAAVLDAMDLAAETPCPAQPPDLWSQRDVWTIAYADSIVESAEPPLRTLRRFLAERLGSSINGVHVLPFCPSSSDRGFAVTDYTAVASELGTWADIEKLTGERRVMADVVINHCSSRHPWFVQFQEDGPPGNAYFVEVDPGTDLSAVVRPRTSPLLRPTETPSGVRHVWCTFSHDQVDLDFSNPDVLLEFVRVIRLYLDRGITVFRLDAVPFLWKEIGTDCINRRQTHELVRLLRTLTECAEPGSVIVTETNIPNRENLSYFGNANEAHLVYNFSLPPLVLHTLLAGDCGHLRMWLMGMPPAQPGTTFLNFLASHDGIGLRPAEGLLTEEELDRLIRTCREAGGEVSWRSVGGEQRPYEINVSLFDALGRTYWGPDGLQCERFVCGHAVVLGLEGIPAFYLHSLLATPNDLQAYQASGEKRAVNRRRWRLEELDEHLDAPDSVAGRVHRELLELIRIRSVQPAFHPDAAQFTLQLGDRLFGFWRQSPDRRQSIFAVSNVTDSPVELPLSAVHLVVTDEWWDLISGERFYDPMATVVLAPYRTVWISNHDGGDASARES